MVSFIDVLLEFLIAIICFIFSAVVMIGTDSPLLGLIPMSVYILLHVLLKRHKKIARHLNEDFQKMGYRVLSERPTSFSESKLEIKPAILLNGIPSSRFSYMRQFSRVFEVETDENERFELITIVTRSWSGDNIIDIVKISKMTFNKTSSQNAKCQAG